MPGSQQQLRELSTFTVPSKRLAMDWALVLASQEIAATIQPGAAGGWELIVDPPEFPRAAAALRQYQTENRGWSWRPNLADAPFVFHWGALLWVVIVGLFYIWSTVRFPQARALGEIDSAAVHTGAWWQLCTAITLHENISHLLGNLSTGFLLLGLTMARFGPGIGALAAFVAGVAGNVAGVWLESSPHHSLGASGMVTGALGLVTAQGFPNHRTSLLPRSIAAGVLLLVLIGFGPGTDMMAHVGGFVAGVALGWILGLAKPLTLHKPAGNIFSALILSAILAIAWWRALT